MIREEIRKIIEKVNPFDELEKEHIKNALAWIGSGEEIFRIQKPDIPPKHLVSYFVLIDPIAKKLLLLDHIKAELWLPSGGHVEKNEHPKKAVEREIREELNREAVFLSPDPFFITQTITVGKTAGHTDVSLWYILQGNSGQSVEYEKQEFNGYEWFDYEEILNEPVSRFDPQMHRFTRKLLSSGIV